MGFRTCPQKGRICKCGLVTHSFCGVMDAIVYPQRYTMGFKSCMQKKICKCGLVAHSPCQVMDAIVYSRRYTMGIKMCTQKGKILNVGW